MRNLRSTSRNCADVIFIVLEKENESLQIGRLVSGLILRLGKSASEPGYTGSGLLPHGPGSETHRAVPMVCHVITCRLRSKFLAAYSVVRRVTLAEFVLILQMLCYVAL